MLRDLRRPAVLNEDEGCLLTPTEESELLDQIRGGDRQAVGRLVESYRDRLWRMLEFRLDRRMAARLSAEDVLQESFLDASKRIDEYLARPDVPVYVWLRFLTIQRMLMLQRQHLGAKQRDVSREVDVHLSPIDSESMAGQFASRMTSPSNAAIRREMHERLRQALDDMEPLDREVLALRHFEELGNNEVALVLGISKDAASKRHIRALQRLRLILDADHEE